MSAKLWVSIGVALMLAGCAADNERDSVNPVVGDASWIARHGTAPPANVDEHERVQTHLAWAAEQLAQSEPPGLSASARANRAARLADLASYAAAGRFPLLDAPVDHRVPRFRDAHGTWCAVGFLVARSEPPLAESIADRYEYARISEMDDPRLDAWAASQGFTRTELATIQPTYGFLHACNGWGNNTDDHPSGDECPGKVLKDHRFSLGFNMGGGYTSADGNHTSYFLVGAEIRVALAAWLAIGIGDLGVRVGHTDAFGNHTALVATPLIELSRWGTKGYRTHRQIHLDLGLTSERVFAGHRDTANNAANTTPYAAQVAVGWRFNAPDIATLSVQLGAEVALVDGFVIGDMVSRGSIAPYLKFVFGFRLP
jgi:hypothetical protein